MYRPRAQCSSALKFILPLGCCFETEVQQCEVILERIFAYNPVPQPVTLHLTMNGANCLTSGRCKSTLVNSIVHWGYRISPSRKSHSSPRNRNTLWDVQMQSQLDERVRFLREKQGETSESKVMRGILTSTRRISSARKAVR